MIFLNLYTKSPWNSGLKKKPSCIFFFQTDMIFFDQFKTSMIKFGKCFAEFMIPINIIQEILYRAIGIISLERLFPSSIADTIIDFKIQCRIKISFTSRPIGTRMLW